MPRLASVSVVLLTALSARAVAQPLLPPLDVEHSPRAELVRYLNGIGHQQLRAREKALASVTTRAGVEAWQRRVREKILRLSGGLPPERTPLAARTVGRLAREGYSVEKVIFESQPGF